jgi:hypothetical protein
LLRQEQAWRVDLNDGVRVNIAPIQLAGLLVSDVLKAANAKKAIADRARWRSDERRWVRAGKLPRCGWMGDDVPESQEWCGALLPCSARKPLACQWSPWSAIIYADSAKFNFRIEN